MWEFFVDFDICHRMVSLQNLTYFSKVKDSNGDLPTVGVTKDSNRDLPSVTYAHTSLTSAIRILIRIETFPQANTHTSVMSASFAVLIVPS